eukprot:276858-Pyramimonas_sp.AAC.1
MRLKLHVPPARAESVRLSICPTFYIGTGRGGRAREIDDGATRQACVLSKKGPPAPCVLVT